LRDAGAEVELIAPEDGQIQAFNHLDKGSRFTVDHAVSDVSEGDYDALVLPGGVASPDNLRTHADAVEFAASFFGAANQSGRSAMPHGRWWKQVC
jgi:protease I